MSLSDPNLFDFLNQIFSKKRALVYDKKKANAYMLSWWLSHDPTLINIVQRLNHLQFGIKDDIIYEYYMAEVPKKRRFIKWTKKTPEDKKRKKFIDGIMMETGVSKREALMLYAHQKRVEENNK